MAIGDDFTITQAGDIRADTPAATYTVLELHRWLQDLADNASTAGGSDDVLDITSLTPSERSTDEIITLINGYNIDDATAEWFYGGSIKQGSGATETLYSGLRVLGSVIDTGTQVQVVQDKALYDGDAPFWGDQTTPFNGGGTVLCRFLVKSREFGCDIDEQKILVQIRNYFDSYATFDVTLGEGEAVAAVSSVNDPQNDTTQATVTAYTHVTNTEGFQQIDIGDGNGNQPYYSQWTYGADTSGDQKKAIWEFAKDLTATGTAKTIHGIDGELFRGITHSYTYDNLSGTFTEDEEVVWGTGVTYDTLAGGTFTAGNYVRFGTGGNAGRIMYDNGTTFMIVALENITGSITPVDTEVMTEYAIGTGASGVTAAVDTTTPVADPTKSGGLGILLASDTSGLKHHIQLRTGSAPVDNLPVRGLSSAATADVAGSVTPRTINPIFLGSYVGTMIGGFGVGFLPANLTNLDTVIDLDGDTNTPPNNVTWTLSGVVVGDRILVGPKDTGNNFKFDQMTLTTTLNAASETSLVVNAIPANTPQAGTLRVELDDGRYRRIAYTAHNGTTTFTIADESWLDPNDATGGAANGVMVSYLDKAAGATSEPFTTIYTSGPLPLWVRVREGTSGSPIKTFQVEGSLTSTGGGSTASRIDDF
jgi:hypothetical protein